MNDAVANLIFNRQTGTRLGILLSLLIGQAAGFGGSFTLQGQSKGSTNWITSNLQNWQELDYIPCRIYITGGPLINQTLTVDFPHLSGTTPGFQDLTSFVPSSNAILTSAPNLTMAASGRWTYTFKVNVTDGNPAYIQFLARLAAGSHLNTGSSLMLDGTPQSMGQLQLHKPAPGIGAPDLAIIKSGPATAAPGQIIAYTLSYTNKADGTNIAHGVQVSDILPAGIMADTNALGGGRLTGNTIFWDLSNQAPAAHGQISFQARVDSVDTNGFVLSNFAQVLSAENDANYADNSSTVTTKVVVACSAPLITLNPLSQTNCPESSVIFSVSASGTAPLNYQWRKNGSGISSANNSTFSLGPLSASDAGSYDVVVSNACGWAASTVATLTVNTFVNASALSGQTNCPGTTALFSTVASGTGPFNYQWCKNGNPISGQSGSSLTLTNVSAGDAGTYSIIVSGACANVTNSATFSVNTAVSASSLSSITNCPGTTAIFASVATGTGPLNYQWLKNGSPMNGATANSLTLTNVSVTDVGTYSVIVSGACRSVTNSATLSVNTVTSASVLSSQTNCPGTTAIFSTVAGGTGPFSYQWLKNESIISGQSSTLTLTNVNTGNAGTYSVIVSGVCGSVTNSAMLVVNANVSIVTSPTNQTTVVGGSAIFSVSATGTGLNYQWYHNGSLMFGQTSSALSLSGVTTNSAGTYCVVVSCTCGSPQTNCATLTVNESVTVITPPVNQTNCPDSTAVFNVTATGTGLSYQWHFNNGVLGNQTNSTLVLTNVSSANAGTYKIVVNGAFGEPVTNSVILVVNTNVSIVTPPSNQTSVAGSNVVFSIGATGTDLSYQWYYNGAVIPNETNSTLNLSAVTTNYSGLYCVVVSGACGSPQTNCSTLTVNAPVTVITPPTDQINCPGTTAVFNETATGTALTYQWYFNGGILGGHTNNLLTLTNVSVAHAGTYCIVAGGAAGGPLTNCATLTVNTNVTVITPPFDSANCPGSTAILTVTASGTSLSYQWYFNAGALDGQTNNTLVVTNVSSANTGTYQVVVSGECGTPSTNSATLVVNTDVSIVTPAVNQTSVVDSNVVFSVGATGTGLNYQWYHSGAAVLGETNSSLSLSGVTTNSAGAYYVIVSGACGSPQTNCATLTVNAPVTVVTPPTDQINCPGTTAVFNETATGTAPSYQWFFNGGILTDQTNSLLLLTNVTSANAGTYCIVAGGAAGGPLTNCATLTVNTNVTVVIPPLNVTNCPGDTAVFGVTATGTSLSYQWYFNHGVLDSQTNSTLVLTNLSSVNAGTYQIVVSGECGMPVTNSAILVLNSKVIITTPTVNQTTIVGSNAVFSVEAIGTGLSYQWYYNGTEILGETNSILSLSGVTTNSAGNYCVVVSGACGAPQTNCATLTVNAPVTVITPPTDQISCPGTIANFSETATGTALTYQWYFNGGILIGETNNFLTLSNVTSANAGTYCIVADGAAGGPLTNCATLTVNTNVTVVAPPLNATNCPGDTAVFGVTATGTSLSYQWYHGTNVLSGQTNSALTITNVTALHAGTYTVVVSGPCGLPVTNSATLTVNVPVSVALIGSVIRNIGSSNTFAAVVSGTGPFSFQWFKDGNPLTGRTNSTLTLTNLQLSDVGQYGLRVTGACGTVPVTFSTLILNLPPTVAITNPTNNSVFIAPATFSLLASASDPDGVVTNVEFFHSTNAVDFLKIGETNIAPHFLVLTNLMTNHYSFTARATDDQGATGTSTPVNVMVIERPPLTLLGGVTFNPQSGLFHLTNIVFNPTYSIFNAVRVYIFGLSNSIVVVNASGTTNGVPYVQSAGPILPSTGWTNTIKFFVPVGALTPNPKLVPELIMPAVTAATITNGTGQHVVRGVFLQDRNFMVEFVTTATQRYYIQFSSDLKNWTTVQPSIPGNGTTIQWIDAGPPETDTLPSISNKRFYKVISTP